MEHGARLEDKIFGAPSFKLDKLQAPGYNGIQKEDNMKTKEAINILNHAVEYFDMNYNTGNKRDTTWEISKVWKALNHVASELDRKET